MEFMNSNFKLDNISRNLLSSIWYQCKECYTTKEEQGINLYRLLWYAFGSDITNAEYKEICNINDDDLIGE